tara:strand:+ start:1120 stop:1302 length:183 start_codon:yes stop_codon:yes gene_type:complete
MSAEMIIASSVMFGFSFTLLIAWVLDMDRKDEKKRSTYDWYGRLQDGETLTPENMFEEKK